MTFSRHTRQFFVAVIFLSIIGALSAGVYFAFIKAPETCFDSQQNQNELGVDCGGVCQLACQEAVIAEKLQIKEIAFVPGGTNRYDTLGKIYNPNDQAGASSFTYVFELKDQSGQVLVSRKGESYILPQETKDLIELNLETSDVPVLATIRISDIKWEKFSGYREKPTINIYQKRYTVLNSGPTFSEAYGLVVNESPHDFRSIYIKIILRDANGKPLALNMTRQDTLKAGEQRDFRLPYPQAFPGTVEKIEMEVDADVYHSDNFIQQYFPGGKFQEFTAPEGF